MILKINSIEIIASILQIILYLDIDPLVNKLFN